MIVNARYTGGHALYRSRNFYGALAVNAAVLPDGTRYLQLVHGRTEHGNQLHTMSAERYIPTSYYSERSGAGVILRALQKRMPSMRVGTIGLGVGTISAYARPGDLFRFYEINPTVIQIAESRPEPWFDFVPRARRLGAQVEFVLGDARLSLEQELRQSKRNDYDVFIVDAFNGDSIPVHLLTVEAMELYLQHLRDEDSVIALHISNRAVDLRRIAAGFVDRLHLHAIWVVAPNQNAVHHRSDWVLLSRSVRFARLPEVAAAGIGLRNAMDMTHSRGPVLWTDDFSNVWEVLDLNRDLTSGSP
jgi:spermidine synthase